MKKRMRSELRRVVFEAIEDSSTMAWTTSKDFAYAMAPIRILSRIVGTWPLQDYDLISGLRSIAAALFVGLMLIIMNVEFYLDRSDAGKNLDVLVLGAGGLQAIVKVLFFRVRCDGLVSNFTSALKDYNEVANEEKREIMRRHAHMGRLSCGGVIFFSYFGSTLYLTVAMLAEDDKVVNATQNEVPQFPIPSDYIVTFFNVPANWFLLIFAVEYVMLIITSTGNLGSDSLFFGIVFHLCGQVEILKTDFSRLEKEGEKAVKNFNALVLRHQYLLRLAGMLNDTISSIMILQLFSSCVLTVMSGFQFIMALQDKNVVMIVKTFLLMGTLMTQLFAYSYIGDYLKRQMEGIGNSAYCSDWYDVPKSLVMDIIFVMIKAQEPVQIMAGGFFCFNLENYISILKTSMSYLSVLRAMVVA